MKLERVIEEANALVAAGYREIVLSGINLGRWGRDFAAAAEDLSNLFARCWSIPALKRFASARSNPWTGVTT